MALEPIGLGSTANDGEGDSLRVAGAKINLAIEAADGAVQAGALADTDPAGAGLVGAGAKDGVEAGTVEAQLTTAFAALSALDSGKADAVHSHTVADITDFPGLAVIRVFHDDDASAARPDVTYVEWVGSVEPENIENGDTFVNIGD